MTAQRFFLGALSSVAKLAVEYDVRRLIIRLGREYRQCTGGAQDSQTLTGEGPCESGGDGSPSSIVSLPGTNPNPSPNPKPPTELAAYRSRRLAIVSALRQLCGAAAEVLEGPAWAALLPLAYLGRHDEEEAVKTAWQEVTVGVQRVGGPE